MQIVGALVLPLVMLGMLVHGAFLGQMNLKRADILSESSNTRIRSTFANNCFWPRKSHRRAHAIAKLCLVPYKARG